MKPIETDFAGVVWYAVRGSHIFTRAASLQQVSLPCRKCFPVCGNFKRGTCDFDTELFRKILEVAKRYSQCSDPPPPPVQHC